VFRSKHGDYVKILTWDGSGLCLFAKRLEKERFVWPPIEGALQLNIGSTGAADRRNRLAQDRCA
jgi:transposase